METLPLFGHLLGASSDRVGLSGQEDAVCVRVRSGNGGRFRDGDEEKPLLGLFERRRLGFGASGAHVHHGGVVTFTTPGGREAFVPARAANLVSLGVVLIASPASQVAPVLGSKHSDEAHVD